MTDPIWTTNEIRLLFSAIGAVAVATIFAAFFGERIFGMDDDD